LATELPQSTSRALISLCEEVAGKLACYVEGGENLISEACPERCQFSPDMGPAMRDLCGVWQESLTMAREPEAGMRWSP